MLLTLTEPFRYVAIDMTAFGANGAFRARNVEFLSEKPSYKVIVQNSTSGAEYQGSTVGYMDSANNMSSGFTETVSSGDTLDLSQPGFITMTRPTLNNGRAFDKWVIVSGSGSILNASDPSKASAIIDEGEVVISPTFKDSPFMSNRVAYSGGLYQGIFLYGHSVDPSALLNAPADKITASINNSGSDTSWVKQAHQSGEDILLLVNNTTGETSFPSGSSGNFPSGYTVFVVHSLDQLAPAVASALTPDNVNVVTTELPPATVDDNLTKWLAKQIGATQAYHMGHPADVADTYGSFLNEIGYSMDSKQLVMSILNTIIVVHLYLTVFITASDLKYLVAVMKYI